jgi:ribulose-phosphate 3-epimerase
VSHAVSSSSKIIAPSLLSADFSRLAEEIRAVEEAGADWLHVDVMDGHFVPNLTWGPPVVRAMKKVATKPLDVHLMITNPEAMLGPFIDAGADVLTIHIESTTQPQELLRAIRHRHVKAGLTLRPETSLAQVTPFLGDIDLLLVMTVSPGFGGQAFMPEQVRKIEELARLRQQNGYNFVIEVDGGINDVTARDCALADAFVAGNFVFGARGSDDALAATAYRERIQQLRHSGGASQ